jgi:AcrR family transcriptional regulator
MGRREEKREATREQMVAAAADLFAERGYEATTVDDIVQRANLAKGTFYYHFESKDEVALAVLRRMGRTGRAHVETWMAKKVPAFVIIRDLFKASADWIEQNSQLARACFAYGFKLGLAGKREDEGSMRLLVAEVLRTGQERGEVRKDVDALELARMVTMLYSMTVMTWAPDDGGDSLHERTRRIFDVLFEGMAPKG